jgi:hypothetical protein
LTIYAASPESALAMLDVLSSFGARLEGWREIVIPLTGGDREIVAVFNALEKYVTERDGGPAHLELNGRSYVMHPTAS